MLTGSVGAEGRNLPDDVRQVQELLQAAGHFGGPADGVCREELVSSIRRYQAGVLRHPDGRVDVDGATWRRLSGSPHGGGAGTEEHHDQRVGRRTTTRQPVGSITDEVITRWVTRDGKEVRFASREGIPPHREWTHAPYILPVPVAARSVPVVLPYRTPLVPGGFNPRTSDRVRFLDAIRTVLRLAGLNWDARVLMPLWANESGWDRDNYGNNVGNVKAQGCVYSPSFAELIRTKHVFVTVPESIAVMVFADRVSSMDGYNAFPSPAHYASYVARVFRAYPGALRALEHGGLDGAEALASALQRDPNHGYSPSPEREAVAMFRGCFRRSRALIGAERFAR